MSLFKILLFLVPIKAQYGTVEFNSSQCSFILQSFTYQDFPLPQYTKINISLASNNPISLNIYCFSLNSTISINTSYITNLITTHHHESVSLDTSITKHQIQLSSSCTIPTDKTSFLVFEFSSYIESVFIERSLPTSNSIQFGQSLICSENVPSQQDLNLQIGQTITTTSASTTTSDFLDLAAVETWIFIFLGCIVCVILMLVACLGYFCGKQSQIKQQLQQQRLYNEQIARMSIAPNIQQQTRIIEEEKKVGKPEVNESMKEVVIAIDGDEVLDARTVGKSVFDMPTSNFQSVSTEADHDVKNFENNMKTDSHSALYGPPSEKLLSKNNTAGGFTPLGKSSQHETIGGVVIPKTVQEVDHEDE